MFIKDDFSAGAPISQVPASWFNRVAKFLNSLIGGANVTLNKNDDGGDSVIEVSGFPLLTSTVTPSDVTTDDAAIGESTEAARADHVHKMPKITASDVTDGTTTVATEIANHATRIAALESSTPSGGGTVNSVDGVSPGADGDVDLGALTEDDIGASNGVQAYSAKLTNLDGKLNEDGTLTSSAVSDPNCTSGGDCLAYFTADKTLAHLGASETETATVTNVRAVTAAFNYTTETGEGGVSISATLDPTSIGVETALTEKKVIGIAKDAKTASLMTAATVGEDYSPAEADLALFDANGDLTGLPIGEGLDLGSDESGSVSSVCVNFTPEDDEDTPEDIGEEAEVGTSTVAARFDHVHKLAYLKTGAGEQGTITGPINPVTPSSGYNDTWTDGKYKPHNSSVTTDDVGVKIPVCTGGAVDSILGMFCPTFRILTFDRNGRLYSVSAETYALP